MTLPLFKPEPDQADAPPKLSPTMRAITLLARMHDPHERRRLADELERELKAGRSIVRMVEAMEAANEGIKSSMGPASIFENSERPREQVEMVINLHSKLSELSEHSK